MSGNCNGNCGSCCNGKCSGGSVYGGIGYAQPIFTDTSLWTKSTYILAFSIFMFIVLIPILSLALGDNKPEGAVAICMYVSWALAFFTIMFRE